MFFFLGKNFPVLKRLVFKVNSREINEQNLADKTKFVRILGFISEHVFGQVKKVKIFIIIDTLFQL